MDCLNVLEISNLRYLFVFAIVVLPERCLNQWNWDHFGVELLYVAFVHVVIRVFGVIH